MPGPHPKDPSVRARTNKTATRAVLRHRLKGVKAPPVPPLPDGVLWRPQVEDWWKRAFSSPMSDEWDTADVDAMYMAAALLQSFWDPECGSDARVRITTQVVKIMGECGLTPMARRRLQWQIEQGESASDRTAARRTAAAKAAKGAVSAAKDPREARRA